MTEKDKKELKKILFFLAEYFPREVTTLTVEAYYVALKDLTIEQIKDSSSKFVKFGKYFPRVAELRELATQKNHLTAGEAWAEVIKQVRRCAGTDDKPVFSSDLVKKACLSVGGVNKIWMDGVEQEKYTMERFIKNYVELSENFHYQELINAPSQQEAKQILGEVSKRLA